MDGPKQKASFLRFIEDLSKKQRFSKHISSSKSHLKQPLRRIIFEKYLLDKPELKAL